MAKLFTFRRDALNNRNCSAFTMLEMSVVLAIIAVVVAGSMTIFSAFLQKSQLVETQNKLRTIQKALLDFRIAYNRLPCPADVTLALSNANFGIEGAGPGSCTGGTPAANFSTTLTPTGSTTSGRVTVSSMSATTNIAVGMGITGSGIPPGDSVASVVNSSSITLIIPATATASGVTLTIGNNVEGMVPTTTLRLPDDYAIDGWGHRIMYAVDNRFTAPSSLTPYPVPLTVTTTGPAAITTNGTITQSSTSVTSVISINSLTLGMYVYGSGIPTIDTIAGISGSTLTLSAAAASDGPNSVSEQLSFSPTFIPNIILSNDTTQRMTVNDQSGNAKSKVAAYVLVSFGPNSHGAYPRNGAAVGSRISSGSNNADEQKNCDCNSSATSNAIIPGGTFVQEVPNQTSGHIGDPSYYYDDVVAFGTRSDLRGPTE